MKIKENIKMYIINVGMYTNEMQDNHRLWIFMSILKDFILVQKLT